MHTTDDRGNRVKLIPQRKLGIVPGLPSPIPMEARHRIWGEMQEHQLTRQNILATVLAIVVMCLIAIVWTHFAPKLLAPFKLSPIVQGIAMGMWPFLALPPFVWFLTRANRVRIARTIVKHGYCASCGYSLAAIALAEDRCTVCPECGSAWRRDTLKNGER